MVARVDRYSHEHLLIRFAYPGLYPITRNTGACWGPRLKSWAGARDPGVRDRYMLILLDSSPDGDESRRAWRIIVVLQRCNGNMERIK
jgi:hypothetical protein